MNPFDLRGPQFLVFYVLLTMVTILVLRAIRRHRELRTEGGYHGSPITDPYMIAFLRGGKDELVRVATVSLMDRGLLSVSQDKVRVTNVGHDASVRKQIERSVLGMCGQAREPRELFEPAYGEAVAPIETELAKMRLLPDETIKAARRKFFFAGTGVLVFFALAKIAVALSRGRTNVFFLIVLCALALLALSKAAFPRRTARGDVFMREVENLFRTLKLRAPQLKSGGATTEVAMLAAVWGVSALPRERFPWAWQLFPKAASNSGSATSSCGSSSSCSSSSCGGGCGGGGCGGCGS